MPPMPPYIWKLDLRATVLNVARGHNWVVEQGANSGQAVNAILKRVGLPPGNPWCAAFVNYIGWLVLREEWPLKMVGGCATMAEDADAKGVLRAAPDAGAVFLLWGPKVNRFRHTGFLWQLKNPDVWFTVEGNTNIGGSPEGTGVFIRERSFAEKDRFIWYWEVPHP